MLSQLDTISNGKWMKPLLAYITNHCLFVCFYYLNFYCAGVERSNFWMRNMRKRNVVRETM